MDGELGAYIRAQIAKTPIMAVSSAWDNGFRHVTSSGREIRTPEDLKNFKLRVPAAPDLTSLFQALGAGPAPINFNEVYSALQTKVVDGQENPLPIIATARLYEVQKTCSLTGHVWDNYWILGNKRAFEKLPKDVQADRDTRVRPLGQGRARRHREVERAHCAPDLTAKGMQFIEVDRGAFRQALAKTSFYADWKAKFGEEAWAQLEKAAGKLS